MRGGISIAKTTGSGVDRGLEVVVYSRARTWHFMWMPASCVATGHGCLRHVLPQDMDACICVATGHGCLHMCCHRTWMPASCVATGHGISCGCQRHVLA